MLGTQHFNCLGLTCLVLALVAFSLLLNMLPNVDGVLDALPYEKQTGQEGIQMLTLPFYVLTEGRVIALYWSSAAFLSLMAMFFGLFAYRRQESSLGYSSAITVGLLMFLLVFQYRWMWMP